jgi:large subunit ribosomal protein L7/L12
VGLLTQLYAFKVNIAYDDYVKSAGGSVGGSSSTTATAAAAAPEPQVVPVKTIFDVKLVAYDDATKIKVIKEVRAAIPGLGLKEAKELVEAAPKILCKDLKQEAAEELQQKLQALGATVEIV